MRLRNHLMASAVLLSLAGCASHSADTTSHMTGTTFRDTSALTVFIADILANSLTPGQTTLRLLPYEGEDPYKAEILLTDTLRERGFALSPDGMVYPGAHVVRYAVSPVGQNLLLELDVDDANATCLYGHAEDGTLLRVGSCTLRSGASIHLRIPAALSTQQTIHPQPIPTTHVDTAVSVGAQMSSHVEHWTLIEGQPIRDQMIAWADRAGWKIDWPHDLNWTVPAMTTFSGDYTSVMSDIIRTLADEGKSIRGDFHRPNHFLVISSPGGAGR
ncbi:TcpQ domain-containing protein [Acetobacter syzygii]|uniref:Toxin co-regulated pilus biosynthesis protein Q C-terminal domain-containing protein n=1 Tax=Acetobacter syzygii TaxID=146476 RepID=A0A270B9J0_9PROT|nr:TcpQ domain-containing protein [Acetobacter syzygii]NSL92701.1 TcpQ domain-containing protein [Acetobacter syzygii]PAL20846.1 hypothetical protein B9K05_12585 [Acetobacter syzygii]PAL22929.1 hypothetical protein B9K04_12485 [Acetobacter syzygii]